jgi:DNA polymerase III epsilon subunit family exonuclease
MPMTTPRNTHPQFDAAIDEADFCVVDVETTGLSSAGGDRVCEIGAVRLRGGAIVDTFGTLVNPQRPVSAGAYAVNRISPAMLQGAPEFTEIVPRLKELIDDSILVAYNAPFDLSFISMEFRLAGHEPPNQPVVDALTIARQLIPGLSTYRQEHVARTAGLSLGVTHRALEDTLITAQLFTIFTTILKAHDCPNCSDLKRNDLKNVLRERRLGIVDEALTGHHLLWLKYLSPVSGDVEDTIVLPKGCTTSQAGKERADFLVGHCRKSDMVKDFRIDRILDLRVVRS